MKKSILPTWVFPLALLGLTLLAYGLLLPQLGLYWDDWAFAWTRANLGLKGLVDLFEVSRPIRGWLESLLTPLLGTNLLRWQAYALLMRALAAVYFWWFLRQLWPERRAEAFFAASLLVVYPGYTQQPQAITYHYYWTFLGFLFLSFGLMVRAVQRAEKPVWWMYVVAIGLCALQLASMEYLLGLEILRPILLWLALTPQFPALKERIKRTVLYEIPFALALAAYLYWRFFLYKDSVYSPVLLDTAGSRPVATLVRLFGTTLNAIYTVLIEAWAQIFRMPSADQLNGGFAWVFGLVILVVLVTWAFLLHAADDRQPGSIPWSWILFGLGGMLVAGLPFLIAGLPILTRFPENRSTLPFMPLMAILFAGLLNLIPGRSRQFLVAGFLLAFATGFQIQNTVLYRDQFKLTKSFFWQLSWRAPGLKPGTSILSQDDRTFLFDDDEALSYPLNWIYAPDQHADPLPYQYQFISLRLQNSLGGMLASPRTSKMIVVRYTPSSCLHVLDPFYDRWLASLPHAGDVSQAASLGFPLIPEDTLRALPISNPAQILPEAPSQPWLVPALFGTEPEHGWCYTYQKADLARQQGDWDLVARLGDQAITKPLLPNDPYEYLPFIEAYARLGRIKDARLITRLVATNMPLLRPALCAIWLRAQSQAGVAEDIISLIKTELQTCPVP
ncbi:MAG TPA: hypothetical protein VGK00_17375 [Anaerolineales bacterium]